MPFSPILLGNTGIMSKAAPELNMVILANAGELSRGILSEVLGQNCSDTLFGEPVTRLTLYQLTMSKVQQKLNARIQAAPTGQYGKSVQVKTSTHNNKTFMA